MGFDLDLDLGEDKHNDNKSFNERRSARDKNTVPTSCAASHFSFVSVLVGERIWGSDW
jgi:hypothetical protein